MSTKLLILDNDFTQLRRVMSYLSDFTPSTLQVRSATSLDVVPESVAPDMVLADLSIDPRSMSGLVPRVLSRFPLAKVVCMSALPQQNNGGLEILDKGNDLKENVIRLVKDFTESEEARYEARKAIKKAFNRYRARLDQIDPPARGIKAG